MAFCPPGPGRCQPTDAQQKFCRKIFANFFEEIWPGPTKVAGRIRANHISRTASLIAIRKSRAGLGPFRGGFPSGAYRLGSISIEGDTLYSTISMAV
jgi:hypothetical protein